MRLVVAVALAASTAVLGTAATSAAHARDHGSDGWSMKSATEILGATDYWDAGFTGAGIDVAIIDTGVAPVPGLDAPGKVIHGPDLSFESQNPALARLDTNGHGTFMAGLIAGHDATLTWPYSRAPEAAYRGVAPDARIVSVKVGVADGGVDVTQVIAAIDWVVDHRQDITTIRLHSGATIQVNGVAGALPPDTPVTLGIRPEHLATGGEHNLVETQIMLVEPLGSHSYVYLDTPDAEDLLIFRASGDFGFAKGDRLTVGMAADHCHLFGKDGRQLRRKPSENLMTSQGDH